MNDRENRFLPHQFAISWLIVNIQRMSLAIIFGIEIVSEWMLFDRNFHRWIFYNNFFFFAHKMFIFNLFLKEKMNFWMLDPQLFENAHLRWEFEALESIYHNKTIFNQFAYSFVCVVVFLLYSLPISRSSPEIWLHELLIII